jgi:hypothetical protein
MKGTVPMTVATTKWLSEHRKALGLLLAAIAGLAYLFQRETAMAPVLGGILWAIPSGMLIVALYLLPIWRLAKVQLAIGVLVFAGKLWWDGSPHAGLQLVKADEKVQWRGDGTADVLWTAEIKNQGYGTRVVGHEASKLIPDSRTSDMSQRVADAIASLERDLEQRPAPSDSAELAAGAQRGFTIQLEPLSVNQMSSWRAEDRSIVIYLLRLEYSDWHGFYRHVRYVCRFGNLGDRDKRPCPGLDDL